MPHNFSAANILRGQTKRKYEKLIEIVVTGEPLRGHEIIKILSFNQVHNQNMVTSDSCLRKSDTNFSFPLPKKDYMVNYIVEYSYLLFFIKDATSDSYRFLLSSLTKVIWAWSRKSSGFAETEEEFQLINSVNKIALHIMIMICIGTISWNRLSELGTTTAELFCSSDRFEQ